MRLPVNIASNNQQQHQLISSATIQSIDRTRRRSRSQFLEMSTSIKTNAKDGQFVRPNSVSPSPNSESGSKSSLVPEIPSFLQDPVLNRTYARGPYLGKGGFAWCYEITDVDSQIPYALKVIPKTRVIKEGHRNKVMREISIHYPLRHKHIVQLYSAFEDDRNIYMTLELCHLDSLVSLLKKRKTLTECECRYYLFQLFTGVRYLHEEARILHRDLKLGNMLLTDQNQLKICDLGLATEMGPDGCDHCGQVCGTPNYISPEVLRKQGHSSATEAWAIGCIMYAMLVGKPPFETDNLDATYSLIINCRYSFPTQTHLSSSARDLIRLLLNQNPNMRPTAVRALQHDFFSVSISPSIAMDNNVLNMNQLNLFSATGQVQAVRNSAVVPSVCNAAIMPAQYIVVHKATTTMAMYHRASTPYDILEHQRDRRQTAIVANSVKGAITTGQNRINQQTPLYVQQPITNSRTTTSSYSSTSTMGPSSIASNPICAMDQFGNTTFGPDRDNAITQWLYEMYNALKEVLVRPCRKDPTCVNGSKKIDTVLYVSKWIDYSNQYGFGCQFNNGGVSIMQNNRKRLCLSTDRRFCRIWYCDQSPNDCVNKSNLLDLMLPVAAFQDSMDLIRHFVDYMDANLLASGYSELVAPLSFVVPFIVLWRRFPDYLLIVFSDGTFQVNFLHQHTKVVLSRPLASCNGRKSEVIVTFINESRIAHSDVLSNAIGSIVDRSVLQNVRQLLGDYILNSNACLAAEL